MLKAGLDYEERQDLYWTDSKVVLGFISSESRRFHLYVANRVQFIRDQTSPKQWRYVESGSNPADKGSMGVNAKEFMRKSQWIRGPDFLWQTEDQWLRHGSYQNEIQESSPEVRKVTANATVMEEHKGMLSRFERFSNRQRLKTAVALCMKYKRRLRMSINTADRNLPVDEGPQINGRSRKVEGCPATRIMVQDLEQADVEILKLVQTSAFDKEVKTLTEFQA